MLTEDEKYHVVQRLANDDAPDACRAFAKLAGIECGRSECGGCMRKAVDAIERRMMPEGMEWPMFEDGGPVRIGDAVESKFGTAFEVECVEVYGDHVKLYAPSKGLFSVEYGELVKRPDPEDTQERIDADAEKGACSYFGWHGIPCCEKSGCPASGRVDCDVAKTLDLLRRQRELDARKEGA